MSEARFRCFIWVLNNYTPEDVSRISNLDCKYMLFGYEIAESGTPHLQGMCYFGLQKTFAACKTFLGCKEVHVEACRNIEKSVTYCKKGGHYFEFGQCPATPQERGKLAQARWSIALEAAKTGRFEEIEPQLQISQARNLEFIYNRELNSRKLVDTTCTMLWLWGPTGTGKSMDARAAFPGAYQKMCNKWWDGYTDQDVAMMEDFDKEHKYLCHHLKIWLDRYPFTAEVKGLVRTLRPKILVVTSNYPPSEIWLEASDLEPILRRVKVLAYTREVRPLLLPYHLPVVAPPVAAAPPPSPVALEELEDYFSSDGSQAMVNDGIHWDEEGESYLFQGDDSDSIGESISSDTIPL